MIGLGAADADLRSAIRRARWSRPRPTGRSRSKSGTSGEPMPLDAVRVDQGDAGGGFGRLFLGARGGDDDAGWFDCREIKHFVLPFHDKSSRREGAACARPTSRGWSRPERRTTGQGGYLTTLSAALRSQLRAQCRMFAGFPLRPRHYTAGTLVAGRELRRGPQPCQAGGLTLGARAHISGWSETSQPTRN